MLTAVRNLLDHRELIAALAWKNISVRYKQAYLGIAWSMLKPLMFVLMFSVLRSFVGIDSGPIPYPILTFVALIPWVFFQETTSEAVGSVVGNAHLIRKIYFRREVFPITAAATKLVEMAINFLILAGMMAFYGIAPTGQALWVPLLIVYTLLASLAIAFVGAALNVYYRDVGAGLPVALSLLMYVSPVIYPLSLVKERLAVQQAAGEWSNTLYTLYTLNPLAGIIDGFQRALLYGQAPDGAALLPGVILTLIALPISYAIFKRAEDRFADVV